MSFPYVSHVRSNVKGSFDVKLGPKTIIIGENGSGKTRIVSAIELALTGKSPVHEIADKVSAMPVELMRLKGDDSDELFAEVVIEVPDEGAAAMASWRASGSLASASKAKHKVSIAVGDNPMPLRELRSTIVSAQDAMRELFITAIEKTVSRADVDRLLLANDEALKLFNERCNEHTDSTSTSMFALGQAVERAEENKRRAASAVRDLDRVAPVGNIPTEEELRSAQEALEHAREAYSLAEQKVGAASVRTAEAPRAKDGVSAAKSALIFVIKTLRDAIEGNAEKPCPVCLTPVDAIALDTRMHALKRIPETRQIRPGIDFSAVVLKNAREAAAKAQDAMEVASAHVNGLTHQAEQFAAYAHSQKQLNKARADVDKWKRVEADLTAARDALLTGGAKKLEAEVQKFLPSVFKFRVMLEQGNRRVCYFGLDDGNGNIRLSLSGAESAIVQVAIALATSNNTMRVIVPTDCSMSPRTLVAFMNAVSNAPAQVIITTTTEPAFIPLGWTVVRTDKGAR